ncbi:MAG: transcription antitermination factor NusB [Eubacteriales bacterium]
MTRTVARELAMHMVFALSYSNLTVPEVLDNTLTKEQFAQWGGESRLYEQFPNQKQADYIRTLVQGAFEHSPELDEYISEYAVGWAFARIPRVVATILRVAMYEILYMPEIPNSAAINDAIEIAKRYDDPKVVSFANGILGSFVRSDVVTGIFAPPPTLDQDFDETDQLTQDLAIIETEEITEKISQESDETEGD